jgi:methionyl aminopeptidase
MIFTIEPMLNAGKAATRNWRRLDRGHRDKSLSAQWEHMVAVTETGFEVLTPWPEGTGDYPAP